MQTQTEHTIWATVRLTVTKQLELRYHLRWKGNSLRDDSYELVRFTVSPTAKRKFVTQRKFVLTRHIQIQERTTRCP